MKKTTKEQILEVSLLLFSEKGYDAVRVKEIADVVGIKAPSIYKHFKSKQDIFNAILEESNRRYALQTASFNMEGLDPKMDVGLFETITDEHMLEMGEALFNHFLHDEFTSKIRKLFTIEQFKNQELANLYVMQYMDSPLQYQRMMFELLIKKGLMRKGDPEIMAMQFFSPIFLLLVQCDANADKEMESLEKLKRHIIEFNRIYRS
ncbi:TetR/AcrR family transcriptional regulator [[Clostridium] fimetarium]|uniref:DNA-binding transcriptional regulator, AcrR family n=1 Tax=[Clostridium] fimetarium TaxID=99656 RepID=A0A1I0PHV4_9FIRM|nr:TetR/AcrR family transcriptional regulator [[Clostridium] fimetarium]SEW13800.1 DNA-binding transcriptional regulator, AcrR family [[Clostridium] fimetarium]